jgi:hypothetical protein
MTEVSDKVMIDTGTLLKKNFKFAKLQSQSPQATLVNRMKDGKQSKKVVMHAYSMAGKKV